MATSHSDYCIIGGGFRMSHAQRLTEAGHTVQLFEKARGLGGRCATGARKHGRFLHGLQFLHIRDERVESILHHGWNPLTPLNSVLSDTGMEQSGNSTRSNAIRFFPETSTFCKAWTANSTVHMQTRINKLEHNENGWTLQ